MKHLLRRLHLTTPHGDGHTAAERTPGRPDSGRADQLPRLQHSEPGSQTSLASSGGSANHLSSLSRSNSFGANDFYDSEVPVFLKQEEEYQLELAKALSMSVAGDVAVRSDPAASIDDADVAAAKRESLGKPGTAAHRQAEALSYRYWSDNHLEYRDRVPDGFYDVFGEFLELVEYGAMPALPDLQRLKPVNGDSREVLLVDHSNDTALCKLEEIAVDMVVMLPNNATKAQSLAQLVSERCGGSFSAEPNLREKWFLDASREKQKCRSVVLHIGSIHYGLLRHRALLFKVLADAVGLPARVLRGEFYTGQEDGAMVIVQVEDGGEYVLDLLAEPGMLSILEHRRGLQKIRSPRLPSTALAAAGEVRRRQPLLPLRPDALARRSTPDGASTSAAASSSGSHSRQPTSPLHVVEVHDTGTDAGNDDDSSIAVPSTNGLLQDNKWPPGALDTLQPPPYDSNPSSPPLPNLRADANPTDQLSKVPSEPRLANWTSAVLDGPPLMRTVSESSAVEAVLSRVADANPQPAKPPAVENWPTAAAKDSTADADQGRPAPGLADGHAEQQEVSSSGGGSEGNGSVMRLSDLQLDVGEFEISFEDIRLGERIGIGSYGEVFKADWQGSEVAVKKFLDQDLSPERLAEFRTEVGIMRRLRHPNVVLFMGAITRPPNLAIVTEFLPRGSLFRLLHKTPTKLDDRKRMRMAYDVVKGMNYLHNCRPCIVHRDLKSPNLLVDKNWVVKVCDFGLSRLKHHTFLSTRSNAGTPEWMAPEVLRNEPSDEKADVYSFGVILWELMTLEQPWRDMNAMQVVGAVGFQHRRLPMPDVVDPVVSDIIQRCWHSDPAMRPSFSTLLKELKPLQRPPSANT
eukprot:jgi/Chlat1/3440/Chrsp23S03757